MFLDCMAFDWVSKLAFQESLESAEETLRRHEIQSGLDMAMGSTFFRKRDRFF